jgi:hypothetical protein
MTMRRRGLFGSALCAVLSIAFAVVPARAQPETPAAAPNATEQAKPSDPTSGPQASATAFDGMIWLRGNSSAFDLEYSNATRRRVLETLAAETGVVVEWRSEADAAERISGRNKGTFDEIVDQMLTGRSFIAAYEPTEQGSRIVHLMIQGKAGAAAAAPEPSPSANAEPGVDASACGGFAGAVTANIGYGEMLLDNGSILYAGGVEDCSGSYSQAAVLFDTVTNESKPTGKMSIGRSNFPMFKLPEGDVLVFGGESLSGISEATDRIERYSVATGTWGVEAYLAQAKSGIATCPLKDGSILLVGGVDRIAGDNPDVTRAAEIYTPAGKSSRKLVSPTNFEHRGAVKTLLLQDGRCLIASEGPNLETYDPANEAFAAIAVPADIRNGLANLVQIGLLPDGKILLVAAQSMTLDVGKNEYHPVP